jgi:hypothetical protein
MGIIGEGGFASLSGTNGSATPVTIADFRPGYASGPTGPGPDGKPCSGYILKNNDTTGTLVANIRVSGLHENSTTSSFALMPGQEVPFARGVADDVRLVQGWTTTTAGATTSSTVLLSGGVFHRKG